MTRRTCCSVKPRSIEQTRVRLGRQHRLRTLPAAESGRERLDGGELVRDGVRRIVVRRRHLKHELAAGSERRREPRDQRGVILDPVQRRVREHQVEGAGG